jgi:hypothetical protein
VSEQWEGTVTDPIEREVAERSRVIKSEPTTGQLIDELSDLIKAQTTPEPTGEERP